MVSWRAGAATTGLLALSACAGIAGYRDYTYAPAAPATCEPVVLPTSGDAYIRLVNLGTASTASDFCVRPSGTTDWGTPVLYAGAKAGCDTGLAYATATEPFAVKSGAIDVVAIAPGATCTSTPTSSATSIAVSAYAQGAPVVTVIRMGGGSSAEELVAHAESRAAAAAGGVRLRVVNGLSGEQSINMGLVAGTALPQTVAAVAFHQPIAPGGVAAAGLSALGAVDAAGYLDIESYGGNLGFVFTGSTSAFAAFTLNSVFETAETVFAIGDPASNAHPIRGLACIDSAPATATTDAGGAPGKVFESCSLTDLPTLEVDTVTAGLYGAGASFESERRAAVYAAIAARQADVMCIVEASDQSDKDAIIASAKSWYPYSYYATADLSTAPTNPALADGGAPPVATAPPCNGVGAASVQNIYACTASNCSTDAGTLALTDNCLAQECVLPFGSIYQQGAQDDACYDCIIDNLTSFQTLAYGQTECTTDVRQPFAFNGQTTGLILSHYPLVDTDAFILPATNYRRQVLYAELQLPDAPVDFYCGQFSAPSIDTDEPYVGDYGTDRSTALPDGGFLVENGYEDEQNLQAQRLVGYVTQKSKATGRPAIIAGNWDSSVRLTDAQGDVLVDNESPEVVKALNGTYGGAFVRADPPNYVPLCDECPQNPYFPGQTPLDVEATFLFQYPPDSTTEESMWATDNDVPIHGSTYAPPPDGGMGPPFEVYARSVRLVRPRGQ